MPWKAFIDLSNKLEESSKKIESSDWEKSAALDCCLSYYVYVCFTPEKWDMPT